MKPTQTSSFNTLYLIDISAFIFRAFYAVRDLTAPDGTPVNAVYGVASMLGKLLEEAAPEYLAVIYDSKEPSFRKVMYPEYKANRSACPEPLIPQFDIIEQLIEHMGIPSFRESGVEADDLIATLRKVWIAQNPKHRVVVVTGDKDLMALVDGKTQVWDTMKDVHYTEHEVREKFGVAPNQIRDYLAMVGDASDNIPGITGVGPKGAELLLKEFKTLDGVLQAAKEGKIKGKKGEVIAESKDVAYLSRDLATLKEDVDLHISVEQARFHFQVKPELLEFFKKYNFKQLYSKYSFRHQGQEELAVQKPKEETPSFDFNDQTTSKPAVPVSTQVFQPKFTTVTTMAALNAIIQEIQKKKLMALDVETTSLDPKNARLVGVAISYDESEGFYIPVGHQLALNLTADSYHHTQLTQEEVLAALRPVLESSEIKKVGQNLKYDLRVLQNVGAKVKGVFADTMLASYLLDSSGQHNLAYLLRKYLNYNATTYEEVVGKGAAQVLFDEIPIDVATRYSAEDAWGAFTLWRVIEPHLVQQDLDEIFHQLDVPLVEVVAAMEEAGIKVDVPFLQKLEVQFNIELKQIEEKIQKFSKNPSINLNSPKQLAVFLFEELKLPTQGKTKTGFSTDASVLEKLAPLHEVPRMLLEYREIMKLKGTYVLPLQTNRSQVDSRVRTSFNLAGTATGRLSSTDPNLQNIPTRTKRGQLIRQAFVADAGSVLLSADYSQIELRILAHMSEDPNLIDSFVKNEDVHRRTASEIYHIDPKDVTDEQRAVAKAINFGLMYGKGPFALAEELGISRTEAKKMIEEYFKRYSKVKHFLDSLIVTAREQGYVMTIVGRKRLLPEIKSANHMMRAGAERMAMNAPIQGTASDMIKIAMIRLYHLLIEKKLKSRILLQVHDELVLECPKAEVEVVSKLVQETMEGAMKLKVPLNVNVGVGNHWAEL